MIGAVTGPVSSPHTLLLGRYDKAGKLRLVARTTPLNTSVRRDLGRRTEPAGTEHPWRGRHFSAIPAGRAALNTPGYWARICRCP